MSASLSATISAGLNKPSKPRRELLPDFCNSRAVFIIVVIGELVAVLLTIARGGSFNNALVYLAFTSLFIQTVALLDACILCYGRRWLARLQPVSLFVVIYLLLQVVTLIVTEIYIWMATTYIYNVPVSPKIHLTVLFQHMTMSMIISAITMRYFYIRHQWRQRVVAENQARIQALTARIRPHFLFNSMNTIASLVHDQPDQAESAILDLADLFRSTLADPGQITIREELHVTRQYLTMEQLRLGERLQVVWDIPEVALDYLVPALSIQPLVENAIYHGVEPIPEGGTIHVSVILTEHRLDLLVTNPVREQNREQKHHKGNKIAVENIRQRLQLFYEHATLESKASQDQYTVIMHMPIMTRNDSP